jgi:hypothetical protein
MMMMMMKEWYALFEEATKYEGLVAHSGQRVGKSRLQKCSRDQRPVYKLAYDVASSGVWGVWSEMGSDAGSSMRSRCRMVETRTPSAKPPESLAV